MLPHDLLNSFGSDFEPLSVEPDEVYPRVNWESHLEMLPLATWICSPDGSYTCMNTACRRLLGVIRVEDLADGKWVSHLHLDDRNRYMRDWTCFLDSSTARFWARARWVRPDTGKVLTLNVRVQRLISGKLQGWVREATAEMALSKLEEMSR